MLTREIGGQGSEPDPVPLLLVIARRSRTSDPEAKCADAKGHACEKQTIGLLQRRHIQVTQIKYIGKESNNLEEVESGLVQSARNVYHGVHRPATRRVADEDTASVEESTLIATRKKERFLA